MDQHLKADEDENLILLMKNKKGYSLPKTKGVQTLPSYSFHFTMKYVYLILLISACANSN